MSALVAGEQATDATDRIVAWALAAAGAGASLVLSFVIPTAIYDRLAGDAWFESDLPRIFQTMTSSAANPRSTHHPVFAIVAYLPTQALIALGLTPLTSTRLVWAGFAALWPLLLFRMLRAAGCRRIDSLLLTLVGLLSAVALSFLGVPETFLVGSLTVMIAMAWAARDEAGRASSVLEVVVSAATLAISITNWMVSLVSAVLRRGLWRSVVISLSAFALVAVVWLVQSRVFKSSQFFLGASYLTAEREHLFSPESLGPTRVLAGFVFHPFVMPAIQLVDRPSSGRWPLLLTQPSAIGSSGLVGGVASVLLGLLLVAGTLALFRRTENPRFRCLLATVLIGQCALHLVFGNETFFYSLHWVPLFLLLMAQALLVERWRSLILALVVLFGVTAATNNVTQVVRAIHFVKAYEPSVARVERAEKREARQADPWPTPALLLQTPWDRDDYDQAAYEAGGTVWPAMDTFNVAFWVVDAGGKVIATSHMLAGPEAKVTVSRTAEGGPVVESITPYYRAKWVCENRRSWTLELDVVEARDHRLFMMLRGVGWRASRVREVTATDRGVLVNRRWRVEGASFGPIALGHELADGGFREEPSAQIVTSEVGWAFAKIGPIATGRHQLVVADDRVAGPVDTVWGQLEAEGRIGDLSRVE